MGIKRDFAPVTKALNAFVRKFDEEYSCTLGPAFEAINDEIIIYTVMVCDNTALSFRNDFIKRFPACADFNLFTLSFMHELGHLETALDTVNDIEERNEINAMSNRELALTKYYQLYNECLATNWAGQYLTKHHKDMKVWENKITKLFKKVLDKHSTKSYNDDVERSDCNE